MDSDNILWSKILHRNVGGVVRATSGIDSKSERIRLEKKDLVQTLGHVVKNNIRPRACEPFPAEDN